MKLNEGKIKQIEHFLDQKGLKYLDLRNEVLDHIANGIEKQIEQNTIDFSNAFEIETAKWKKELANNASWWLGIIWSGPKIMIDKCVKMLNTFYLFLVPMTVLLFLFFLVIFYTNKQLLSYSKEIETIVGVYYLLCVILILLLSFKIKASNYKSSYSYFFKIQAIAICLIYLMYNPLWTSIIDFVKDDELILISLLSNCLFILYPYLFCQLYKSHFNVKKVSLI